MGTNFYIRGYRQSDDPKFHVGKRSAAGLYCWDCDVSLCMGEVHSGRSQWYEACPKCGKKPTKEDLSVSASGRELGFNKSQPRVKTGVCTCSSFSWGIENLPQAVEAWLSEHPPTCPCCGVPFKDTTKVIEDEYGELYSEDEFEKVLAECPIQFFEHIGKYFS